MKVLHVINSLATGGAEKLLLDSLPIFREQGLTVDLLLINGTEYPFLTELNKRFDGTITILSKSSFVYNPLHIIKIQKYLRGYDIVHVHLFPALYLVAFAKIAYNLKVITLYTEHNTNNKRRDKKIFNFFDKLAYASFLKIITIADEVDINLKKYLDLKDTSKFKLINNGVDCEMYHSAIPYPKDDFFNEGDIILIQVSSFREQKDQKTLIKAIATLPDQYKLLLVGTGPLEKQCKDLATHLALDARIKFLGIRMDVPRLLKTADVTVLSSHHEGLSLSSIEAMASGKPFIASNVPGLREIVKGAGLLFEEGDEQELAANIEKIMSDEDYYNLISKKCVERANSFDLKKMVTNYAKLYNNVFKG